MKHLVVCLFVACLFLNTVGVEAQVPQWMAVLINGKKVGYYKALRIVKADTVVTTELLAYIIDAGTEKIDFLAVTETMETSEGKLIQFRKEAVKNDEKRRVLARLVRDTLQVSGMVNDKKSELSVPWADDVLMVEGRRLLAVKHGLRPGTKYRTRQLLIDPMKIAEIAVDVGESVDVHLIERTEKLTETRKIQILDGREQKRFVYRDGQLRILKVSIPDIAMELIDCSEAYALIPSE